MARYWFGDSPADFVVSPGSQEAISEEEFGFAAVLVSGAVLWVWDYQTGDRITDLLDSAGAETDQITAQEYGRIPRFRGPDGVRRLLIGQADPENGEGGEGAESLHKWTMTSTNWPEIVDGIESRVADLEEDSNGEGGESALSIPLLWSASGEVEDHTSDHPYVNLEGRPLTVKTVRAQAHVSSGGVTVRVLTVDMDTGSTSSVAAIHLDTSDESGTVDPDAAVSEETGITVEVELDDPSDEVENVTVQVMIR